MIIQSRAINTSRSVATSGMKTGGRIPSIWMVMMTTDGHIYLAVSSFVTWQAAAAVPVRSVLAGCAVEARIRAAFINVHLTIVA